MALLAISVVGVPLSTPLLLVLLLPLLFVAYTFWLHSGRPQGNPLVWSWVPHLRSALLFGRDPNAFLAECRRTYGPVFTLNLGGRLMTFVTEPTCYPLITRARDGLAFAPIAANVGVQVLSQPQAHMEDEQLDAAVHAQYIKYLTGASLDDLTARFQQHLQTWMRMAGQQAAASNGRMQGGLLDLCTRAIFSASTRALFGDLLTEGPFNPQASDATFSDDFYKPTTLLSSFQAFDRIFPMLYGGLPHFLLRGGIDARDRLIQIFKTLRPDSADFFQARRELFVDNPPTRRPDDEHNFGASQNGMLWALQGNSIPATFWTLFFLLQHPEQLARVRAEIDEVSSEELRATQSSELASVQWSRDALRKLTLLDGAISESLRLCTGSLLMRRATKDLVLELPTGPLACKAGADIAIYPWLTHHDPSLYPNPDAFQIDRWAGKGVEGGIVTDANGKAVPNAFMPFGSGISICPGRHFARNEIKLFLVMVLHQFDLAPAGPFVHPGYLLSRAGLGIFPPAKDVDIVYSAKQSA